jgi:hypothetical protein
VATELGRGAGQTLAQASVVLASGGARNPQPLALRPKTLRETGTPTYETRRLSFALSVAAGLVNNAHCPVLILGRFFSF